MMESEQQSIHARITSTTKMLLQQACQERRCSQGDIVEAALVGFLTPAEGEAGQGLVLQKLAEMEQALTGMVGLLQALVEHLAEVKPAAPPPAVATYQQMYGPLVPEAVAETSEESPAPVRLQGWRRWFYREDPV